MWARNRVGIGLSYLPTAQHRLAESVPWNRFLGSLKVQKYRLSTVCLSTGIYFQHFHQLYANFLNLPTGLTNNRAAG
jgi:hypothetical protein